MKYFVKVSASVQAKNNLQKRVSVLAHRWDRVVTDNPQNVGEDLKKVIAEAKHRYPRCQPMGIDESTGGFKEGAQSHCYWLRDVVGVGRLLTVTLYRVEDEPLPMVLKEVSHD